ncbi:hypothetical protein [Microbacterium sp. KR10-403]|uniref:hypothetical protein n=1 Tax=Microbacterium sp. KR10-403 TaxID=3158581 RepID=UPI0032E36AC3
MKKATLALASLAVAGSLAFTGCAAATPATGGKTAASQEQQVSQEGPAFADIADKVSADYKSLTSLSFTGNVDSNGTKMDVTASGELSDTGDFTLAMKGKVKGETAEATIVRVSDKVYIKASELFFKNNLGDSSGTMAKLLGDKYLLLPEEATAGMDSMTLKGLMSSFDEEFPTADDMKDPQAAGTLVDFEGRQVYSYAAKDDMTYYITTDAEPQLAGFSSTENGKIVLSDYNSAPAVTAPAEDEVMDLSALQQQAG